MKKLLAIIVLSSTLFFHPAAVHAQDEIPGVGIVTGLIKRVIKAIDLKIQRMQNKTIALQNAQKAVENAMSQLHLTEITGWVQKQKDLYTSYYNELWQVKTALTTYWKVKDIIQRQVELVNEYNNAWNLLKSDRHFTIDELDEMYGIYTGILDQSLKNIDQLMLVCNALTTQMDDGKRMELIASADKQVEKNLADLRSFNNRNARLSLARSEDQQDAAITKKMYGL